MIRSELIPNDSDVMTLRQFYYACDAGALIDYDGYGYWANDKDNTMWPDTVVLPSDVLKNGFPDDPRITHVVWFNR